MRNNRGFTLLEVLVAMAITAVVGVMAYTGMSAATSAHEVSKSHMDDLNRLNLMFAVLSRDLQQLAPRPVNDEFGDTRAALVGDDKQLLVLGFTRHGWINALDQPRSQMQRVNYRLEDGKLYRRVWYVLDRVTDQDFEETVLIEGVESLRLGFLDSSGRGNLGGDWQEKWPLLDNEEGRVDKGSLPRAIEFVIELEQWGELRRIYEIAS